MKEKGESESLLQIPSPAFMAPVWVFAKRRRIRIMAIDAYIYLSTSRQTTIYIFR